MAEKAMHVLLVFLSYSPGYDVFQGGSRHVPAIFPHTCTGRRLLSFIIPEEGRRLLHGKGRKKASCPCRAGSGSASSCRIRRAPCVFSARRTRKACRAFREEGRTYPLRSSTEKAGQKGGRPPLILRLREGTPCTRGMRSSDGADVGPAGEIPASAKRHPMTRPLPKPSMGKSRAGGDARRPVYKEKSLSLKRAVAGARKKSGARRKNVARRRGERADSPVDGLILRVAKLRL